MNGEAFISDLLEAMPTPMARMNLASRLAKYAGQTIYLPAESERQKRVKAAFNMLENGMVSNEIIPALIERYRISDRTASRDVNSARKMSLKNGVT